PPVSVHTCLDKQVRPGVDQIDKSPPEHLRRGSTMGLWMRHLSAPVSTSEGYGFRQRRGMLRGDGEPYHPPRVQTRAVVSGPEAEM
ncbi:hypothetical protein GOODEAATRI_028532, partial [Goodea atripinnis]